MNKGIKRYKKAIRKGTGLSRNPFPFFLSGDADFLTNLHIVGINGLVGFH